MKIYLATLLLVSSWAWGAIASVNGPTPCTSATNTTLSCSYAATAGNTVVLGLITSASVTSTSCKDNNNNTLTAGSTATPGLEIQMFYYTVPSNTTSFSCSWTTSRVPGIALWEYSGVGSVNGTPSSGTANGSSQNPSVSPVSTVQNDFMVAMLGRSGAATTWSAQTGNLRASNTGLNISSSLVDNTSGATSGSGVTESDTFSASSAAWIAAAVELKPPAAGSGHCAACDVSELMPWYQDFIQDGL